ncbi:uncharacterized protein H6S33_007587 [Morchella sextelata]|uniref:uncharacterized protein n=1 Tax=Morchella sextelata TaxID=1174677 RepID=UPI001D043FF1|nr:uncharacterized protein H6S33_007587 [Morchella sextelata]KAH0603928.1 hypothetical protein H6S33_007587 [Morchella sextelata]
MSESGAYTLIGVIVERFTKITYFIPLKTEATIKELSHIFLQEIWRLHGLSEVIISYRDFRFKSKFWHSLITLLGVNLCLSTAYRPQADRRKLGNANVSSAVLKFKWKALWKTKRTDIFKAQARQKKWYDQKHIKAPKPKDVDKVMMDRRNMVADQPSCKLDYKKLGLFEVDEKLVAFYWRKLRSQWNIHDVFQIFLLESYWGVKYPQRTEVPPTTDEVEGEYNHVLQEIANSRWQ